MVNSDHEVQVYVARGEIEAQVMRSFLQGHGIACRIAGEALRITHGFTVDGLGEARLLVPAHQAERARDLVAKADAGELALDDDESITDDGS